MEARVRRFRKQVRLENRGRSGIRRRYSGSLRAEAVAYLRERVQGGASAETVASELGVSGWSLSRWRRGLSSEKNSTLQLVQVVADCAEEGTKLIESKDWNEVTSLGCWSRCDDVEHSLREGVRVYGTGGHAQRI